MRTNSALTPFTPFTPFPPFTPLVPWLLLLASCTSPPKPPTVDESQKRPANSQTAVELQVCKHDLQNGRLLGLESSRLAETTAATLANMAARQQALAAMQAAAVQQPQPNNVFTLRFNFASTRIVMPSEVASALVEDAKASPLILLRGRTDGTSDAPAESRIARDRAAAVRNYLVAAGVEPSRIRATYQPAGDHVADNTSAAGRGLNRRVEIELYRALPTGMPSLHATAGALP
jgi:outer membrane protein OmpA-like peptidoglycan-associated protein